MKRTAFLVSDSTGITSETLGHSLLSQFGDMEFEKIALRFVNTLDKAHEATATINRVARESATKPLVFSTLIDPQINEVILSSEGLIFDFIHSFITPLEQELGVSSSHKVGRSHGMVREQQYRQRMDAVNYALQNDDGISTRQYGMADVVLIGISRTGKTPTCLYLALHYGIFAANYPLIGGDLDMNHLPKCLLPHRDKLFGLTINPDRLQKIRNERQPGSQYASLRQCRFEVQQTEAIYRSINLAYLDTSTVSVEEIAASIMDKLSLKSAV